MSRIDRFDPFKGKLGFALASRRGSPLFVSGMAGVDIETDTVPSDLAGQMRQAYKNIEQILAHYRGSLSKAS